MIGHKDRYERKKSCTSVYQDQNLWYKKKKAVNSSVCRLSATQLRTKYTVYERVYHRIKYLNVRMLVSSAKKN